MLPLDIMLRDRSVCGLRDDFLQQRLFAETDLTFAKAYDITIRAESAGRQQRDIRKPTEPAYLTNHQLQPPRRNGHFCKKRGHIEKACITKKKQSRAPPERHKRVNASESLTQAETHGVLPASPALYDLNTVLNLRTQPKIMIEVTVHHQPIHFEVDSGAACTLINEPTYHQTWRQPAPILLDDHAHLRTWSGQALPLLGSANVDVSFNGTTFQLPLIIVRGPDLASWVKIGSTHLG
ncbi:uncharacterized protein LOC144142931 [Haemaphysalis longicornis]